MDTTLLADIERNLSTQGYALSPKAADVFLQTLTFSQENDYDTYTDNYLYGLLQADSIAVAVFENLGVDPFEVRETAAKSLARGLVESWSTYGGANTYDQNGWLMEHVLKSASSARRKVIRSGDILCGLVSHCQASAKQGETLYFQVIIEQHGLTLKRVQSELRKVRRFEPLAEHLQYRLTIDNDRLSLQPFSFFNNYSLLDADDDPGQLLVAKLDVVSDIPFIPKERIDELEWLINQPDVTEH